MQPLPCITIFLLIIGESIFSLLAKELIIYDNSRKKTKKNKNNGVIIVCKKHILNIKEGKMFPRKICALIHIIWNMDGGRLVTLVFYGHYHPN